jgi:hypothetical protein
MLVTRLYIAAGAGNQFVYLSAPGSGGVVDRAVGQVAGRFSNLRAGPQPHGPCDTKKVLSVGKDRRIMLQ